MALPSRSLGSFVRTVAAFAALLGILLSNTMPTFAAGGQTGSLQGVVVDTATRTPIANATVIAASPSGRYTARTDAQGRFSILGLTVDTYVVSISQAGYETLSQSGVNIVGDNTVNLQTEALQKSLQTIGKTTARSRSNAYQPTQTVDSVTVGGQRAIIAAGKAENTSENQLALSVPGVQLTSSAQLTIRGGLATEIGYQLDGIDFTEPFLFGNANNGISVGSSSLQIVEGSGDATQGGIGGGVVNSTLKRGTRPPFGLLDLEIGGPNYNHQAGVEYGFATPDGKVSDYITYVGQRFAPYYGSFGTNQIDVSNYDGISQSVADDFVNNFVYRFGNSNNQSLQVAYLSHDLQRFGDLSGVAGRLGQNYNPYNLENLPNGSGDPTLPVGDPASTAFLNARYGLVPDVSGTGNTLYSPELTSYNPTRYLKFEYTNSLNPTTYLDISTANVQQIRGVANWYGYGVENSSYTTGGQNTTLKFELTHQFGSQHTVTLGYNLDNKHPLWNNYDPFVGVYITQAFAGSGLPSTDDFALPPNPTAPVSAANPCPVTGGCYLYTAAGYTGRLPIFGINYNKTDNQEYGYYLRDQFNPTSKLHFDIGLRYDGLNWKQGANPFNTQPGAFTNPDDVPVGIGPGNPTNFLRDTVVHPKLVEPRLAAAFQISNVDSIRAGYGRSVIFPNAQSLGTPAYLAGLPSSVLNLAPTAGTNTADPSTWTCGSGTNPQWAASTTAKNYNTGSGGSFFRCPNYGQQLYWQIDQNFDAPDVGNNEPQTTSNTDLTYQHQFKNGMALKFTTYYKREFAVPAFAIISQVLNAQGAPVSQVFGVNNVGINKTSGLELGLQTADRPTGFAGYISATYSNVIDSVPPLVANEDTLPLIPLPSLRLGDTYRAGYVSPFVVNFGIQYKTHNGFRINPVISYDRGFPIGVGNLKASTNPFGGYSNLPQSNINSPLISGYNGITGAFNATNYVDPVNPGTKIQPNIAATRGTPETSVAGGILSRPRVNTDVTFEFTHARNTVGLLVQNIFSNPFGEPIPNPYYQPVATGIAGPQTGNTSAAIPGSTTYAYGGFRNIPTSIYGQSAYVLPVGSLGSNINHPLTLRAYYQLSL